MDDARTRGEDDGLTPPEPPDPAFTGAATERVRIVGAQPAAEAVGGSLPERSLMPEEPFGEVEDVATLAPSAELPHWTEPPTGQIPAVLRRGDEDDRRSAGIMPPTWREETADWVAHEEEFEPSIFATDRAPLGSLDETENDVTERRPWEFDFDETSTPVEGATSHSSAVEEAQGSESDPSALARSVTDRFDVLLAQTSSVESLRAFVEASEGGATEGRGVDMGGSESHGADALRGSGAPESPDGDHRAVEAATMDRPSEAAPGLMTDAATPVDVVIPPETTYVGDRNGLDGSGAEKPKPTGEVAESRFKRPNLRARRPERAAAVGVAAPTSELPGASVAEVPGASRRRGGLAALAAADRFRKSPSEASDDASASEDIRSLVDEGQVAGDESGVAPDVERTVASVTHEGSSMGGRRTGNVTGGGPPRRRIRDEEVPSPEVDSSSGLGLRVGTGLAAAALVLVAFACGTVVTCVLTVIVVTFAAGECFGVLRKVGYHPATLLGLVGTIALMIGAYAKGPQALPLILVLVAAFTMMWYLLQIERGSPVAGTAATLMTVVWIGLLGSYAGLLLAPSAFPDRHGIAFLAGAIIATAANDIGALVVGGWLGRHPLAPSISPNKTWEGWAGGAVITVIVSTVIIGAIHPWTAATGAVLGLVVAVVAPVGDLCESLLKRDLRLKDMGTLLPGHGGVLDRVDALLFVLPATYYLVRALHIA